MQRVALKRDSKAFDVLYERFYPLVVTYASQHLHRSSAEETAAEVMIRLWQSAERFDPKKPLRPWLFAVARNALVSFWRRRSAGIPIPSAEEETELQGPATQDIRPLVSEALKSLPEAERHIIVLTYMDGLTSAEIAQRLGVPQAAVSSRQHRALQKMRKALTELRKSG
jgi:RNA polymerase sigma-70 factor (ECF subfamily)